MKSFNRKQKEQYEEFRLKAKESKTKFEKWSSEHWGEQDSPVYRQLYNRMIRDKEIFEFFSIHGYAKSW